MAGSVKFVTRARRVAQLPVWTPEFTELIQHVSESGLLAELACRLRFSYKRGFEIKDLAVFFVALACGHSNGGIRDFCESIDHCTKRLAAIAGRKTMPSSTSVSRGLWAAGRIKDLDQGLAWALSEGAQVKALCRSPLVQFRDAYGNYWTVLDFDPTVAALRQRSLPEDEDSPAPQRRAATLCAPGYAGRHRGETQMSTAVLSHTSGGLFLQLTTHAGNTHFATALGTAAQAGASFVASCGLSLQRSLVRFDGAGGHASAIAQVILHNLHYLTRLNHHWVYEEPGVAELLAAATWHDVVDSLSGPRRQATELGRYVVGFDEQGVAVTSRLVVSRFECADGVKRGAGIVQDGFQYEAFATDLDPGAWPAADTVTLYYGRCCQENQFCRAIRQLRLGEIFCYDLVGQRLAMGLMMWINNLRMSRAAAAVGELGPVPLQELRPPSAEPEHTAEPERVEELDMIEIPAQVVTEQPAEVVAPAAVDVPVTPEQPAGTTSLPTHMVCPRGLLAPLHDIRKTGGKTSHGMYRMPAGVCGSCPQRASCSQSPKAKFRREFTLPLGLVAEADRPEILARIRAMTPDVVATIDITTERSSCQQARAKSKLERAVRPPPPPERWTAPVHRAPGPLLPAGPSLRPSVLLTLWLRELSKIAIEVHITRAVQELRRPWVSRTAAERQSRRRTWAQRDEYNALRGRAKVVRQPLVCDAPSARYKRNIS